MRLSLSAVDRPAGLRVSIDRRAAAAARFGPPLAVAALSGTALPPAVTFTSLRKKSPAGPS